MKKIVIFLLFLGIAFASNLWAQETVGDNHIVIASKGGLPNHPLWYRNLEANPDCEVQVGTKKIAARARTASGDERDRLWKQMAEIYPPYDAYKKSAADRQIPVVVLDTVG